MTPCTSVSSELWDWLADGDAHPDARAIRDHLDGCAACRAEADRLRGLRAGLKGLRETPAAGFEARLRERLAAERAAPAPAGRVVRVPVWRRPLALVASGAAAVLVLGLAGGRFGGPAAPDGAGVAPAPAVGARVAALPQPTGVLGERDWQPEDSLAGGAADPSSREAGTPVSAPRTP